MSKTSYTYIQWDYKLFTLIYVHVEKRQRVWLSFSFFCRMIWLYLLLLICVWLSLLLLLW